MSATAKGTFDVKLTAQRGAGGERALRHNLSLAGIGSSQDSDSDSDSE